MTEFRNKVSAIAELLEQQGSKAKNFAELELLILKATQELGQVAATDLRPSEDFSPSSTLLPEMPTGDAEK
jgi:hypothetical protein